MTLLVISDSHGRDDYLERIVESHLNSDMFIFLGDGIRDAERVFGKYSHVPSFTVAGNCDWFANNSIPLSTLDLDGVKVTVCHGHNFGVKSGLGSYAQYARSKEASLALFGHTHTECEINYDGVIMFNPGAVCEGSYGIVHIEKGAVLCSHGRLDI